jgi:NADH:ubiquinone reductase (H+-translocating)
LVWTAGTSAHPLINQLDLPKDRNRLKVSGAMGVEGHPGVWALGDCAVIPDEGGGYQPPTAQHASREGKVLARNIIATIRGKDLSSFQFKTLGLLASIGRRTGGGPDPGNQLFRVCCLVALANHLPFETASL